MPSSPASPPDAYAIAVPILLLAIMVCMGMELRGEDFRRVFRMPRAAVVGVAGQMIFLPLLGLAVAHTPGLAPEIALGVVLLTACPGGSMSNVFSYLAGANIALSLTLTALSSTLCFLTIPFWIRIAVSQFGAGLGFGDSSALPLGPMVAQMFGVTLLPVAIGMGIRARWPLWSERVRAPLQRIATIVMGIAIFLLIGAEWSTVLEHLRDASGTALALVTSALLLGWTCARAARLSPRDAFTLSIEIGLQNGALATMLIVNVLRRPELIVFPGTYAILSLIPVVSWTLLVRRTAPAWSRDG